MDWKRALNASATRIAQDPRVMKVASNERVINTVIRALQLRGKLQEQLDARVEQIAKSLKLATKSEVRELKRTVRRLEKELEKTKARGPSATKE